MSTVGIVTTAAGLYALHRWRTRLSSPHCLENDEISAMDYQNTSHGNIASGCPCSKLSEEDRTALVPLLKQLLASGLMDHNDEHGSYMTSRLDKGVKRAEDISVKLEEQITQALSLDAGLFLQNLAKRVGDLDRGDEEPNFTEAC